MEQAQQQKVNYIPCVWVLLALSAAVIFLYTYLTHMFYKNI